MSSQVTEDCASGTARDLPGQRDLLWLKQLGTSGYSSFANAVRVDGSGAVFVAGATTGGLAGSTQSGQFDYLIAKYDASGNFLWLKQAGASSATTTATSVALDGICCGSNSSAWG
ncbi:MAG: SBBP repeat-containing protein [Steroidobacterales bacterium]